MGANDALVALANQVFEAKATFLLLLRGRDTLTGSHRRISHFDNLQILRNPRYFPAGLVRTTYVLDAIATCAF